MQLLDTARKAFSDWLDRVAEVTIGAIARFKAIPTVGLVEAAEGRLSLSSTDGSAGGLDDAGLRLENGQLAGQPSSQLEAALRGGRVQLLLRPERFVFKSLELPARASEFLAGVVRSQIDRLTPWSADKAAFGFSAPADAGGGRIAINVAATARERLQPILQSFTALGACSVTISTRAADAASDIPPIAIIQENVGGILDVGRARRLLLVGLTSAVLIAALANVAAVVVNDRQQAQQDEITRQIAQRRASALAARNAPKDPKTVAERALARRKNESPSPVVALEILSQILPDDTYLTELRIESNQVRLTGFTHDAPDLIRLIEKSHHFSRATFFAPITRSTSSPGDRFNIEARMEPDFALTP